MNKPLVSIVLPTRNGERYLSLSIESCRSQTLQDWELIIVDDGSSDGTPDIIKQYCAVDERIKTIRHDVGKRLPGALNAGFTIARAPLFTWTSDDNIYRPLALEYMSGALMDGGDIGLVYTAATNIDEKGEVIEPYPTGTPDQLVHRNCIGASFMYRREVHTELGGYAENQFLVEDYDFWLRASQRFRLQYLPVDLYMYRKHADSLTSAQWEKVQEMADDTLKQHIQSLPWITRRHRATALVRFARGAARHHDIRASLRYMSEAAISAPATAAANVASIMAESMTRRIAESRTR